MTVSISGTGGVTFPDNSVQNTAATGFGFKNRIINGAMVIDQRNAGASVTPTNTSADTFTLDRWAAGISVTSKFSVQQNAGSVTPPVGFSNYLGFTTVSAYTVGAGETWRLEQNIEGFNTSDLNWGTANAKTVTLSFQVYSSLIGTFGGAISNSARNRSYPFSYSIPVANTWTTISLTIAGDTTGTWIGATNGIGIRLEISLGTGSTLSGTAGAWAGATYISATGATSVVATNGATFYITGVQLEVGSSATGFEYVNYQTSLANCQRYYEKSYAQGTDPGTATTTGISGSASGADTSGYVAPITTFKVTKRNSPAVTLYDTAGTINKVSSFNTAGTLTAGKTGTLDPISDTGFRVYETGTSKNGLFYHYVASSEL
jgi:hypothetical protein